MTRPIDPESRRRPRRAMWTPWRRTQIVNATVIVSVLLIAAITVARGVIR